MTELALGAQPTLARTAARSLIARLRRLHMHPEMAIGLVIVVFWTVLIVFAPLIVSYSPLRQNMNAVLLSPSINHLFGTDELGRDVFSRVLYGGRLSLPAALIVVACGFAVGTFLGAVAASSKRAVDDVIMRFTDMVLAFPLIILAMALATTLGRSFWHGIIVLVALWWPPYARVCRGLVLDLKNKEYVLASRAAGRRPSSIMLRVVLPNALPSLLVMAAIDIGRAILLFSILGFLGLGAQPPQPEWGSMVSDGATIMNQWWVATFPALAILTLALAFNLIGDSIRDALDPWVSGRR